MKVKDIRRENLRHLASSIGGMSALAIKLGKSPSQISHIIGPKPLKNIGDKVASEIESAFNKPSGWLDQLHNEQDNVNYGFLKSFSDDLAPFVPILDYEKAADPQNCADKNAPKGLELSGFQFTVIDNRQAGKISDYTFALVIKDNSMEPALNKEDLIIVDPEQTASPGDLVVAKVDGEPEVVVRKYRPKSSSTNKKEPNFELIPINQDWPLIIVDNKNSGYLVGKIIERHQIL